ncbi:MAG: hypothetical protein IT428_17355 [Planctomycetaceae bacterium]|nr:hypothetical protein [Planctomycetaceae bacterium]
MRGRRMRPFGQTIRPTRIVSLLLGVAVLWMVYERFKDPATWKFLTNENKNVPVVGQLPSADGKDAKPENQEIVVPGPNDLDGDEVLDAAEKFDLVTDKTDLMGREMPAYWTLMSWSRTQSTEQLEKRSRRDLLMANFYQDPARHRGKYPVYLRLHVVRALDASKTPNPAGIGRIVEVWGATDESRGNPYCVLIPDPPADLPIGHNISAEMVFSGYFLKLMKHDVFNGKARATPVFIGRARLLQVPSLAKKEADPYFAYAFIGSAIVGLAAIVGFLFFRTRTPVGLRRREEGAEMPESLALEPSGIATSDRFDSDAPLHVDFGEIILGNGTSPAPQPNGSAGEPTSWERGAESTGSNSDR